MLKSKNDNDYKEVETKNIEVGEMTKFKNVAIPKKNQKLLMSFKRGNGDITFVTTNEKGKIKYVRGLENCSEKDMFTFEQIHYSTYKIMNP